MIASPACSWLRPLSIARLRWYGTWATWPEAISALTMTRLRSRGARSGRSHRSRNKTSVVCWTSRLVEIIGRRPRQLTGNESRNGDDAPVPGAQTRALPDLAVKTFLRVLLKSRRNPPHVFWRQPTASHVGLLRFRGGRCDQEDRCDHGGKSFHFDLLLFTRMCSPAFRMARRRYWAGR